MSPIESQPCKIKTGNDSPNGIKQKSHPRPMWESCIDSAALSIGSMYGIYANIWGILMVNVTIYTIHGSYGLSYVSSVCIPVDLLAFLPKRFAQKTETSRTEEFGVSSNFSCQAVSTWSWFSSPMPVWWVMLLGRNWFVSKSLEPGNQLLFP